MGLVFEEMSILPLSENAVKESTSVRLFVRLFVRVCFGRLLGRSLVVLGLEKYRFYERPNVS